MILISLASGYSDFFEAADSTSLMTNCDSQPRHHAVEQKNCACIWWL